jgi:reactive intermediate/imine deaminase
VLQIGVIVKRPSVEHPSRKGCVCLKQQIIADGAPRPLARYSQGVKAGNTLYIQGIIALDPKTNKMVEGDIGVQSARVFESMKAILESAGMNLGNIVKVTAFLSNLDDYKDFNKIYNTYFATDPPPVRTTVQAKMPMGALLEVDAIAYNEASEH